MVIFKTVMTQYLSTWHDVEKTASFKKGARWNSPGIPVLYGATSPQNAMLEIANYLPSPKTVNALYRIAAFELPDDLNLHALLESELPDDWYGSIHPETAKKLGDSYLKKPKWHGILAPSVTINRDITMHKDIGIQKSSNSNVILNVEHIGLSNIKLMDSFTPVYSHAMFSGAKE